jgi:SAM-dependent methyltransferase
MRWFFRFLGVFERRRAEVLADRLAEIVPHAARVLDVGSGDGQIAWLLGQRRPDLRIEGVDVQVRPQTAIPVTAFDGHRLPFDDGSFDVVMFVDVLHHVEDQRVLLREAARVARQIVIKDHTPSGLLGRPHLKFLDWFGNVGYGVPLPYNFLRWEQWQEVFRACGVEVDQAMHQLRYWGWPGSWLLDRSFHFIVRLKPSGAVHEERRDSRGEAGENGTASGG